MFGVAPKSGCPVDRCRTETHKGARACAAGVRTTAAAVHFAPAPQSPPPVHPYTRPPQRRGQRAYADTARIITTPTAPDHAIHRQHTKPAPWLSNSLYLPPTPCHPTDTESTEPHRTQRPRDTLRDPRAKTQDTRQTDSTHTPYTTDATQDTARRPTPCTLFMTRDEQPAAPRRPLPCTIDFPWTFVTLPPASNPTHQPSAISTRPASLVGGPLPAPALALASPSPPVVNHTA